MNQEVVFFKGIMHYKQLISKATVNEYLSNREKYINL